MPGLCEVILIVLAPGGILRTLLWPVKDLDQNHLLFNVPVIFIKKNSIYISICPDNLILPAL